MTESSRPTGISPENAPALTADNSDGELIPRAHLFANPVRSGMSISPDGKWLAWLANCAGVMNIWVSPVGEPETARQVTFDKHRGIASYRWSFEPNQVLFSQDRDGDENWRLFGLDVTGGEAKELTPGKPGTRAVIHSISKARPFEILVSLNDRDPRFSDIHLLNLRSGTMERIEENSGFTGYVADQNYVLRLGAINTPNGGRIWMRRDEEGQWQKWFELNAEDASNTDPSHFSADGRVLYMRDSRGRDTAALMALDFASGESKLIAEDPRADIGGTFNDLNDFRPLAYSATYERFSLHVLDDSIREDVQFLNANTDGEWGVTSRTLDDQVWLVAVSADIRPSTVYLFDRQRRTLTRLFDLRPELAQATLARMQPRVIEARDGLKLVSYITIPTSAASGDLLSKHPVPLVVLVHGGPWARDTFGFNPMHQWLANRGYAVLSVNFRSSTGFGKKLIRAGDGEWGRKMDEDIEDAVEWAIRRGIADPKKLAIFGGSYGGFAALSALTRYPERYACAIDVVGPSNLETLIASIPAYWEAARAMFQRAVGDPATPDGLAMLRERSPLHRAGNIRAPLLIAQGKNDPRVKVAESEQMVEALKANDIPVSYALYPDEGHGFVREPNRMSFNAVCERFLAKYLGGREEPWTLADFPGNTLNVIEDAGLGIS